MSGPSSVFCRIGKELAKTLTDYSSVLNHILFLLEENENAFPQEALQSTEERISSLLEAAKEGIYGLHGLSDLLAAKRAFIKWVPEVKETLEMTWETGITPWSFWLKYTDLTPKVKELIKVIKGKWLNGELEKHPSPEVGSNVIICSRKRTYRGIVTVVSPKFLVTNVDDGKEREEDIDSCYKLTHDFCEVQANVIHCSVARVGVENVDTWKTEYSQDFVSFLQYSKLSVQIVDKIMKVIPTYVIELVAYNEEEESTTNIRDWVLEVCQGSSESRQGLANDLSFPATSLNIPVKSIIPPENLIPERLPSNETKEVQTNRLLKVAESMNVSISTQQKDTRTPPKVPFKFESVIDAPEFSPLNAVRSEPGHPIDKGASATLLNGPVDNKISEASNMLLKMPLNDRTAGENPTTKEVGQIKPKTQFKFESVLDAPEFSPINGLVKTGPHSKTNSFNEMSVIPGNYQPKDDSRECSFFAVHGYCWKIGCTREHKKTIHGKWTNDAEETYTDTFTSITLPEVGLELKVNVTHVSSPTSFYVHLPHAYSVPDEETLEDLIKDLNDPAYQREMMLFSATPTMGEFLIAFSETKKKWLRGTVCESDDEIIQVFFVDYGITEDVLLEKCRKMLAQFNHLPSQAVYCTLSKVYFDSNQEDKNLEKVGKDLLEHYIQDKQIDIKIIDSSTGDNCLEVIASVDNINVNSLIVSLGSGYSDRLKT